MPTDFNYGDGLFPIDNSGGPGKADQIQLILKETPIQIVTLWGLFTRIS